jgi:hypothetical protein
MTNDVRTGFSESYCDCLTESSRGSGYERNFSLKFELIEKHRR